MRPSLLPFTPWSTLADYRELLEWAQREDLVECIDPVQFSIRLLIPPGSLLLAAAAMRPHLGPLDAEKLTYCWKHPDPRMDALQADVAGLVEQAAAAHEPTTVSYDRIRAAAGLAARLGDAAPQHPPRLLESWFC